MATLDQYKSKLYIGSTDIVDIIEDSAVSGLPIVVEAGDTGPTQDTTITITKSSQNGNISGGGSVYVPFFTVDNKGRVIARQNRIVNFNANNYSNYSVYGDYPNYMCGD